MVIALFADIHANREAFEACYAHAKAEGATRLVFLGDLVGYGADPHWVVETVANLVAEGAVALMGNHDDAIGHPREQLNEAATAAIDWTRGVLTPAEKKFLADLPMTIEDRDRLYVHASATAPKDWIYIRGVEDAFRSLRACTARLVFCGHIHKPALYSMTETMKLNSFSPVEGSSVPLLSQRRWLTVVGAVGQPRDGNPAAAYALFEDTTRDLVFQRVPYDIETAALKIRKAGLPKSLSERLFIGR